ncbi:hypothetical protein PoB_002446700 [Plakobranchus ocellatus]|uniref:Uncharacterized protein n=1 Tax=Plakobranchus ocellatus TaxID=259542 RepID=A0AAV3ZTH2_9GAST|nr:hypothetical protein PoB_002446700 [Plakobranchus ocellatus]
MSTIWVIFPEGDPSRGRPTPRGRPCVQRETRQEADLRPEGDPTFRETYAQRETLRPEGDPSRGRPTPRGRPKADFEVPLISPPEALCHACL